jgi:Ca2+-binding RTX toxin-like protein
VAVTSRRIHGGRHVDTTDYVFEAACGTFLPRKGTFDRVNVPCIDVSIHSEPADNMLLFSQRCPWLGSILKSVVPSTGRRPRSRRNRPDANWAAGHQCVSSFAESLEDRTLLAAPHPVDLGSLDGTNGFRLDGIAADDRSGRSVSSAGDVNGDGFADLIIGALNADPGGDSEAGESYVVFGKSSGFGSALDLSTLNGTTGFRLVGIDAGDESGRTVSSAGDVNGDGFDDLIIGAYRADPRGDSDTGESYVVFGKSGGFGSALDLSTLNGTTGFRIDGINVGDLSGVSVSSVGDVNGDGFDDLIIGAFAADPGGDSGAGESYVVFGKSGGFGSALDLSTLNGTTGFRLDGIDVGDGSGRPVSSAGDVNGDGFDDLIIGAPYADPGGDSGAGESYVVFGGNFTGGVETQVGTSIANILSANQGPLVIDILVGGLGNDTLIGDGGADVLRGGEGDDILAIPDVDFSITRRLVGGSGTDTLRLDGTGLTLDLTTIPDNRIVDVEVIDISGSGNNSLTLNFQEVVNISSTSNTLFVLQDFDDTVNIGTGWTQEANQTIDSVVYKVFTQGSAAFKLQLVSNFSLSETGGGTSVSESGTTDTLDVVLIAQPSSDVVLNVTTDNDTEVTITPPTLTFTTANWNLPQAVAISTVDDSTTDGNQNVQVTVSVDDDASDDDFDHVSDQIITVTTIDNDIIALSLDGGGNLVIDDNSTNGLADNLTLLVLGSELLIFESDNVLVTSVGTQVSDNEVRVPLALITNQRVVVNHNHGDDRLNAASLGATLALEAAGGPGDDTITGGSQSDTISGGAGNDSIVAGSGDDIVNGDDGNDDLDGGTGTDTLDVIANSHLSISTTNTSGAGNDSYRGFELARLIGGSGNNRLDAAAASIPVTLNGLAGNDTLLGGSASDRLDGGDGVDQAEINGTNIVLTDASAPGADGDTLVSVEGLQLIASAPGSVIDASVYTLGPVTIVGSSGNDILKGGSGNDVILGGSGSDVVTGGVGNDLIMGGFGSDTLSGDSGEDTIYGGRGRDTIEGGLNSDELRGGGGPDTIGGGDGNDHIRGGGGRDVLDGDDGPDTLFGGGGRDDLAGGLGDDTLNGVSRDDNFDDQIGRDTLIGGDRPAARPAPFKRLVVQSAGEEAPPLFEVPPVYRKINEEIDEAFQQLLLPDLI